MMRGYIYMIKREGQGEREGNLSVKQYTRKSSLNYHLRYLLRVREDPQVASGIDLVFIIKDGDFFAIAKYLYLQGYISTLTLEPTKSLLLQRRAFITLQTFVNFNSSSIE